MDMQCISLHTYPIPSCDSDTRLSPVGWVCAAAGRHQRQARLRGLGRQFAASAGPPRHGRQPVPVPVSAVAQVREGSEQGFGRL